MPVPGSDWLLTALRAIARQPFQYKAFTGRSAQVNGQYLNTYATSVDTSGSVQPVPRNLYQQYGLEFDRNYYTVFVSQSVVDVTRDVAGDQVVYSGMTLQVVQKTNWFQADGWCQLLTVQVLSPTS